MHSQSEKSRTRSRNRNSKLKENVGKKAEATADSIEQFAPSAEMQLYGAADLAKFKLPPRKKHWGHFIRSGQLGMIFAPRGTGKTFFELALAIAMATATQFLDNAPSSRRRVIILDGEMDLASICDRLRMVAQSVGAKLTNRLKIFTPETFSGLMPPLNTVEGQKIIDELIGSSWDILFIDNYSAWSADGRETPESWVPLLRWMLDHKRNGRTVIVLHHTGKNGDQRGTSKHEDALDFSIALKPLRDDVRDGSLNFQLQWKKSRHLASDEISAFVVTMSKDENEKFSWSRIDGPVQDPKVQKAAKMKAAGCSLSEIAAELGVNKSTVSRWLK